MSSSTTTLDVVDECRGVLKVLSDGSTIRSPNPSFPVPILDDGSVIWQDLQFNATHNLQLRLYKPLHSIPTDPPKLPIFFYFHGGGFCIGSRTWPNCQNYCLRLASDLRAIIVSPDYRLSPENRLPSAFEDSFSAVDWLIDQANSPEHNPWLTDVADFSRVFISGDSAGGTIAHQIAVKFQKLEAPVCIRGYVLLGPFFGGAQKTKSEAECPDDAFLSWELTDRFWRLSLPIGSDMDDPLVNPFGPESESLEEVEFAPMMVVVGGCDLLRDRGVEYGKKLKEWGKPVEVVEYQGQQHGFFTINPWGEPANQLMQVVKRFVDGNGCGFATS